MTANEAATDVAEDEDGEEDIAVRDAWPMLRFMRPFAAPEKWSLAGLSALLVVDTAFNISFPLAERLVIDEGLIGRDWTIVVGVLVFLVFAAVSVTVIGIAIDWTSSRAFSQMVSRIRNRLFAHVQVLSLGAIHRSGSGSLLSRLSGDTLAIENALVALIPWLILPALQVLYSTVLMFAFNWRMGLVAAIAFPLNLLAPRFFAKHAFTLGYEKRVREAQLVAASAEEITGQAVVRAFDYGATSRRAFARLGSSWLHTAFRFHFTSALVERTATSGTYLLHVVVFGLGAYWVWNGVITVGTLVAFEGLFLSTGESLAYVTQIVPSLAQASGSIQHIQEFLNEDADAPDPPGASDLVPDSGRIEFRDVAFSYPDGRRGVRDFSLTIGGGERIAIVGPTGCGKSTTLSLLLGLLHPDAGCILIDGQDIARITRRSLRAAVAVVFQDSFLFNTTIADNILVGRPEADLAEVETAARAAEIHDAIMRMPKGYQTLVGERGAHLSGGQRQRVAVARALIRNPKILLLDEATSALDAESEAALLATLAHVAKDRTVVHVTHTAAAAVQSDRVVMMRHGHVVATGSHAELVKNGGAYVHLWSAKQASL